MKVDYTTGEMRELRISGEAWPDSLVIQVGGEVYDPSTYSYDPAEKKIYFDDPLPEGADILVRFKENIPLLDTFPFPAVESVVECYRDQKLVNSHVDLEKKVIRLDPPLPEGSEAYCLY